MTTFRARFDGSVLIPTEPVDLPVGQELEVQVGEAASTATRGAPASILKSMDAEPHLSRDDVAELSRAIEEGKLPPRDEGCFDHLTK